MPLQTIVETPEYMRRADSVGLSTEDRRAIVDFLSANPEAGVSLGGGLRKVRFARPGAGKSGGYRVLHFYRMRELPVFLLSVFAKNEQANISKKAKAALIELCDRIVATYGVMK